MFSTAKIQSQRNKKNPKKPLVLCLLTTNFPNHLFYVIGFMKYFVNDYSSKKYFPGTVKNRNLGSLPAEFFSYA